jgi:hypothetical protein
MQKAALLFALIALPLAAEEQSTPEGEETQKVESTPLPGTSNSPVLPGMGTVPSFQEKRPSPRNPRYQPPVKVPGFDTSKTDPGLLFLFSGGDFDVQRWLGTRGQAGRPSREAEAIYDEEPNGGKSRVETESLYLEQFGLSRFPYGTHRHEESESKARRFSVEFLISLPITMAASYGLFRLGKSAAGQGNAFTRGQTIGMAALGLGMSAGIGFYDQYQNNKMNALSHRSNQIQAAVTVRF